MKSSGWKTNIWTLCPFFKMHLNYLHKKFKVKSFILGKQTFLNVSHNDFLFVYLLVSRWNRSTKTIRTLADTLWRAKSFPSKQTRFLLPERKRIDCFFLWKVVLCCTMINVRRAEAKQCWGKYCLKTFSDRNVGLFSLLSARNSIISGLIK